MKVQKLKRKTVEFNTFYFFALSFQFWYVAAPVGLSAERPPEQSLVCAESIPATARSVMDYGAVGDGKADDTSAIEAAVKAGVGVISQVYWEIWRVHE